MGIGYGRPLSCLCWLLIATVALSFIYDLTTNVLLLIGGLALAVIAALILLAVFRPTVRMRAFYVAFLTLGVVFGVVTLCVFHFTEKQPTREYVSRENGESVTVSGLVVSREYNNDYQTSLRVLLDVPQDNNESTTVLAYLNCNYISTLQAGDRFSLSAVVDTVEQAAPTHLKNQLLADGYILYLNSDNEQPLSVHERDVFHWRIYFAGLQRSLSMRLLQGVGGQEGKLVSALLLGTRDILSDFTSLEFQRSGASHLLALSGLHVSIVILLLSQLLLLMRCPFVIRLSLTSLCAIFYLLLTGCSMSTLRATVMIIYLNIAMISGLPNDSLTSLSLFVAGAIVCNPLAIYDIGMWLSVLAAFALIIVVPGMLERRQNSACGQESEVKTKTPPWRRAFTSVFKSLFSSVMILFFLVLPTTVAFGEISVLSPLSTLLMTPIVTLVLILGILYLTVSLLANVSFFAWIAGMIGELLSILASAMQWLARTFSDIPDVLVSLRYPFMRWLIPITVVFLLLFLLLRWKYPKRFLIFVAAWVVTFSTCVTITNATHTEQANVTYFSHANSELICLDTTEYTVLCDMSDGTYTTYRQWLEQGIPYHTTEVDALVLTHYHSRHLSSVYKLLGDIRVRAIWLPLSMNMTTEQKAEQDRGIVRAITELAKQRRVEVCYYAPEYGASITDTLYLNRLHYSMIKRSTHPTLAMEWQYQAEADSAQTYRMTIIGASSWESNLASQVGEMISHADILIAANHGPIVKSSFAIPDGFAQRELPILIGNKVDAAFDRSNHTANNWQKIVLPEGDVCVMFPLKGNAFEP